MDTETWVSILVAIIGLAIISVILSRNSNTSGVISATGGALSGLISAATSPISGGGGGSNFSISPGPSPTSFSQGSSIQPVLQAITPILGQAVINT